MPAASRPISVAAREPASGSLAADVFSFPGIRTRLALPLGAIASGMPPVSLAERNLLRHLTWGMPSAQAIAGAMGGPVLGDQHFAGLKPIHPPFVSSTPLWSYILDDARHSADAAIGVRPTRTASGADGLEPPQPARQQQNGGDRDRPAMARRHLRIPPQIPPTARSAAASR